jgi:hypothetical protein
MIGLPSLARRVSSMTRQPGIGLYRVLLCTGLFFFNFQIVESKMDEGSMLVVQLTSLQKESCQ